MIFLGVQIDHTSRTDSMYRWLHENLPDGAYKLTQYSNDTHMHYSGVYLEEADAAVFMLKFRLAFIDGILSYV